MYICVYMSIFMCSCVFVHVFALVWPTLQMIRAWAPRDIPPFNTDTFMQLLMQLLLHMHMHMDIHIHTHITQCMHTYTSTYAYLRTLFRAAAAFNGAAHR